MSTKDESPDTAAGLSSSPSIDHMLANWCDQSKSFEWMNTEAYSRYCRAVNVHVYHRQYRNCSQRSRQFDCGNSEVNRYRRSSVHHLECVSIAISIISMLEDKFDWITMANNFKQASVQWSNVSRKLEEQLAVPPTGRKDCGTFLKYIKQDITTVSATNYMIPKDIRIKCMEKFWEDS